MGAGDHPKLCSGVPISIGNSPVPLAEKRDKNGLVSPSDGSVTGKVVVAAPEVHASWERVQFENRISTMKTQVVIVTGGATGIGSDITSELAQRCAHVFASI